MKQVVWFQGTICCRLTLFFVLAALAGCNAESKRVNKELGGVSDPQLSDILRKNIRASGSMAVWLKTSQIEADVLATVLDRDGGKTFLDQTHLLMPQSPLSMTVISQTPEGPWTERLDKKARVGMVLRGQWERPVGVFAKWIRTPAAWLGMQEQAERILDPSVLQGAGLKLRLFSQALTQSFGLLRDDWSMTYGGQERKGGRLSYKVVVNGPLLARERPKKEFETGDQLVVWIDAESFLFDRIWLRYRIDSGSQEKPFVYLAANLKGYQKQANGLMVPSYVGLVHSDRHQQFSETEILRIETLKFRVTEKKKLF